MSVTNNKQYGLIMSKKTGQSALQPRPSVFNENSDSGDEGGDWVKKALKRNSEKGLQKKQTKLEIQRALAADPTVYQYDEIYDKMEEKKEEEKKLKTTDKKPRYIQSLLKQAERRKKEQERRYERDVQREREAEGEEFKDKESFVTAAYRAKLEEFRKMDEQEKRMERIEAIMDVSKQKDLTGFYRHLYRQATGESPGSQPDTVKFKEEPPDSVPLSQPEEHGTKTKTDDKNDATVEVAGEHNVVHSERHYRKRRASSSDREGRGVGKKQELTAEDKDSGGSSSSSDSSSDDSSDSDEVSKNASNNKEKTKTGTEAILQVAGRNSKQLDISKEEVKKGGEGSGETKESISKHDIWEKRTVGSVFEAALERYFSRKAARLAG